MGKAARLRKQRQQERFRGLVEKIETDENLPYLKKCELISELHGVHPGAVEDAVTEAEIDEEMERNKKYLEGVLRDISNKNFDINFPEEDAYRCAQHYRDMIEIFNIMKKKYVGKTDYTTAFYQAELDYSRINKDYITFAESDRLLSKQRGW